MRTPVRLRLDVVLTAVLCLLIPNGSAAAQSGELGRLVALYRSGSVEPAVAGLLVLSRIGETVEQRALVEYHLGLALLRVRPAEASAALRRSISIDPDLRPEPTATAAELRAWEDVRSQMPIPSGIHFSPATALAGSGDSIGVTVDVNRVAGSAQPRVRLLLAPAEGRDPVEVWSGTAGESSAWDGMFRGELPQSGTYPLIVEILSETGVAPIRWRRSLEVRSEPLPQPFVLAPRPRRVSAVMPIRVRDTDGQKRARRRGIIWAVGGSLVSIAASRIVPDAINMSPPNGAPRIAVATIYGAGLAGAVYGAVKVALSATRRYETTVLVPDEAELYRQRFIESAWQTDSARMTSLNARRDALRRITVQVRGRGQ